MNGAGSPALPALLGDVETAARLFVERKRFVPLAPPVRQRLQIQRGLDTHARMGLSHQKASTRRNANGVLTAPRQECRWSACLPHTATRSASCPRGRPTTPSTRTARQSGPSASQRRPASCAGGRRKSTAVSRSSHTREAGWVEGERQVPWLPSSGLARETS